MKDVNEVFDGVQNAEFKELQFVEGLADDAPVFTLIEPSIEVWNRRVRIQNIQMFVSVHNRMHESYQEVLSWIYSAFENEISHSDCGTVTYA